jgi:glycosyltransferase involved in cell wall biosynthesis
MNAEGWMRNVLIYRNELLPPSETFIAAQAQALQKFTPVFAGIKPAHPTLPLAKESVVTLTVGNSLAERMRRKLFSVTGAANGFIQRLQERRPALLHAHFAVDACMALPLAKRLQIPLVVTLHGYDVTSEDAAFAAFPFGRMYLARRKRLWDYAACFICISEFIRRAAIDRGFPKEKLWTHFIGIDLKSFVPEESTKREAIVLFVGRLVEKKGCRHLIQAMARVQEHQPRARLVVIGDGPMRSSLEAEAAAKLKEYQFLGVLPQRSVREWLNRSSVFCVPSIIAKNGDAEGLGIVFCEAQAMGVPVVSFASGGIPEVVAHEESGLLAPEADTNALTENLLRFLTDECLVRRFGQVGRERMHRLFNLDKQTRLLERRYEEDLG